MAIVESRNIFPVPGLEEAYREGRNNFDEFLIRVPLGARIEFRFMTLTLVLPTTHEVALLERSLKEERELGLVTVGSRCEIVVGEEHQVDSSKVIATLNRLGYEKGKPWSNTHTHWDKVRSPFPSIPDRIQRMILNRNQPGCEYRVVFPLEGKSRVFVCIEDRG